MQNNRLKLLAPVLLLTGCSLPDTPLWNERDSNKPVAMSSELTTKVLGYGSARSLLVNPISGTNRGLSMWWNRSRLLADPVTGKSAMWTAKLKQGESIEQALDESGLPLPTYGRLDYLVDGDEFFPALYRSVESAKRSIDTQVFIFDSDDIATDYADRLKKRSSQVKCRVLMDHLGSVTSWWTDPETPLPRSFKPPSSMPHYLREASNVKARQSLNPWLVADHRKLFIFDQKEAYLGGMNLGREYRYEWHDLMVRLRGPIVTELQNEFNFSWKLQGPFGDWAIPFTYTKRAQQMSRTRSDFPIRILRTSPWRAEIEKAHLIAVRMARKRIYLQNSYVTSELLKNELIAALKRGVDVHFIFPADNDSALLDIANRQFAYELVKAGAKAWHYPKFSHVKAIVVDDWACIGSANLDGLSFRINYELNIAFSDKTAVEQLMRRVFYSDIRRSKRLKFSDLEDRGAAAVKPLLQQL